MFKKGNTYGKNTKRGKNKNTKELREVSAMILSGEMDNLKKRLSTLKDSDYIKAIGMLMKHVLPAQKQVEMDIEQEEVHYQIEIIDRLDQVTNRQVENVLDELVEEEKQKMYDKKNR